VVDKIEIEEPESSPVGDAVTAVEEPDAKGEEETETETEDSENEGGEEDEDEEGGGVLDDLSSDETSGGRQLDQLLHPRIHCNPSSFQEPKLGDS
jgi:hypothetical protein